MTIISGYMLTGSKGRYTFNNPDHLVVFNSVVEIDEKEVWSGDLDLSLKEHMAHLIELLGKDGETLEVYHEGGRISVLTINLDRRLSGPRIRYSVNEELYSIAYADDSMFPTIRLIECRSVNQEIDTSEREIELKDMEALKKYPLPKDLKSDDSPIEVFYSQVANRLGVLISELDVSNVLVSKKSAEELNKRLLAWVVENNTYDGQVDTYRAQRDYGFLHLMYSPVCVKGLKDDKVYIRNGGVRCKL